MKLQEQEMKAISQNYPRSLATRCTFKEKDIKQDKEEDSDEEMRDLMVDENNQPIAIEEF